MQSNRIPNYVNFVDSVINYSRVGLHRNAPKKTCGPVRISGTVMVPVCKLTEVHATIEVGINNPHNFLWVPYYTMEPIGPAPIKDMDTENMQGLLNPRWLNKESPEQRDTASKKSATNMQRGSRNSQLVFNCMQRKFNTCHRSRERFLCKEKKRLQQPERARQDRYISQKYRNNFCLQNKKRLRQPRRHHRA